MRFRSLNSGREAETHYTTNGTLVTTLSVATKESWKNAFGAWESRTEWHRVVCFARLAEYACMLAKGSLVMVQGLGDTELGTSRQSGAARAVAPKTS